MRDVSKRIARLEAARHEALLMAEAREVAEASGQTLDQFLVDCDRFYALPLAEQLAWVDEVTDDLADEGFPTEPMAEIRAFLLRRPRP
jgi:hypothetical protein